MDESGAELGRAGQYLQSKHMETDGTNGTNGTLWHKDAKRSLLQITRDLEKPEDGTLACFSG